MSPGHLANEAARGVRLCRDLSLRPALGLPYPGCIVPAEGGIDPGASFPASCVDNYRQLSLYYADNNELRGLVIQVSFLADWLEIRGSGTLLLSLFVNLP
jgi:hypothetical protein